MHPRIDPSITGITVLEVEAGATDVVSRDTNYNDQHMCLKKVSGYVYFFHSVLLDFTSFLSRYALHGGKKKVF